MDAKLLAIAQSLSAEERHFCVYVLATEDKADSYRRAFPDVCYDTANPNEDGSFPEKLARQTVYNRSTRLLARSDIEAYMSYLMEAQGNPQMLADGIMAESMIMGDPRQRMEAARVIIGREDKANARMAVEHHAKLLSEIGADVTVPVSKGSIKATVKIADLLKGRAQVTLPLDAKTMLLHRAGFPFNESDPDSKLSEVQVDFLSRMERFLYLHGGSGLGKSVLGGGFALCDLMIPGHRIAIVGATYDLCAAEFEYTFYGFEKLFGRRAAIRMVFSHTQHNHDMEIRTLWNSSVKCYSLDRDEGSAMLGKEFDLVVVGEGAHVPHEVMTKKILRAVDRRGGRKTENGFSQGEIFGNGRVVCFTTPAGFEGMSSAEWDRVDKETNRQPERLHVGYVDPDTGESPSWHETTYLRTANVLENPSYSLEVYEARKRSLNKDAFEEQYEGLRVARSGLVIKEFSPSKHIIERPSAEEIRQMRLGIGIDTGKYFGATLWGLSRKQKLYGLAEVFTEELSISDNAAHLREMVCEVLAPVHKLPEVSGDAEIKKQFDDHLSRAIDMWYVDSASQHKDDLFEHLDVPVTWEKFELLPTLDAFRNFFLNDEAYLSEEMERLAWEIARYRWARTRTTTASLAGMSKAAQMPRKQDDHVIDASRFIVVPLFKAGPLDEMPIPVSFEENYAQKRNYEVIGHLFEQLREPTVNNIADEFHGVHDV